MKISKSELERKYGIKLDAGKYAIKATNGTYDISTVKDDTDGCILVGISNEKKDDNFIGKSKIAYDILFLKLVEAKERGEKLTIEIV